MFFEDLKQIPDIAKKCDCAIFVVPNDTVIDIKTPFILTPEEDKKVISIEQVRDLLLELNTKETTDRYIIIRPADALNDQSGNALLKSLEEPKEHYHFVLVTTNPSDVLPTILSRSAIYIYKVINTIDRDLKLKSEVKPKEFEDIVATAKLLIAGKPKDILAVADKAAKSKDKARTYALNLLQTSIEILYKSYFKTKNQAFLKKIPKFIDAYTAIENNGHIKTHLIADLI